MFKVNRKKDRDAFVIQANRLIRYTRQPELKQSGQHRDHQKLLPDNILSKQRIGCWTYETANAYINALEDTM